eukprot:snap_masked-scaffold_6-processed-gene-14.36-mRNA-1 protein AED:0.41 eAED:0.41 QI:0/-1/0/1/-1/1/1/0/122
MSEGFDVNRSRVSDDALAEFLSSAIVENIESVPGIGPAAAKKLAEETENDAAVETTFQLIGKFLSLRGKGMNTQEHCDAMWYYLKEKGVNSYRAGIVHALAERCNIMIPDIFNKDELTIQEQ